MGKIRKIQRLAVASAAATAVAATTGILPAAAALVDDSLSLCLRSCSISYSSPNVTEGERVTIEVTGSPGVYPMRAYAASPGSLQPVGPVQSVTVAADGRGHAQIQVDPLGSGVTGGRHFVVQPEDARPERLVPGPNGGIDLFTVMSARAKVVGAGAGPSRPAGYTAADRPVFDLAGGRPDDRFRVEVRDAAGSWIPVSAGDDPVAADGGTRIDYDPTSSNLPAGEYDARVVNISRPEDPVFETVFRLYDKPTR